jgi:hypothetical protein
LTDISLNSSKPKLKRTRKPKKKPYFTSETEEAIIQYLSSDDDLFRNKIFSEKIYYPFYKLAENLIHTFKFYYTEVDNIEDLKHEVITFLLEKLHYFQAGKGKAFSYFSIVGKNYLILYNNSIYKKKKMSGELEEVDTDPGILNLLEYEETKKNNSEFLDLYVLWMDYNLPKIFPKTDDEQIADAVLEIFKKRENIEIFNKKALYIFIKEINDVPTPNITKIIKVMKKYYIRLFDEFETKGFLKF